MHEFNVQTTVVALIRAGDAQQAIDILNAQVDAAGFQPHLDIGKQHAFHSDTCTCGYDNA